MAFLAHTLLNSRFDVLKVLLIPFLIFGSNGVRANDCEDYLRSNISQTLGKWFENSDAGAVRDVGIVQGRLNTLDASHMENLNGIRRHWNISAEFYPLSLADGQLVFELRLSGLRRDLAAAFFELQQMFGSLTWRAEEPSSASAEVSPPIRGTEPQPDLPTEPPRELVTPPSPRTVAAPAQMSVTDWSMKGGHAELFAPSSTRLTPERPIALITSYRRPVWAVVHTTLARSPQLSATLAREAMAVPLPGVIAKLPEALSAEPQSLSDTTGTRGFASLKNLAEAEQPILMVPYKQRKWPTERQERVVLIPLVGLPDDGLEEARVAEPPSLQKHGLPPVIPDKKWRLGIEFDHMVPYRSFVADEDHFTRYVAQNLHWATPLASPGDNYRLHYPAPGRGSDDVLIFTFSLDVRGEDSAVVTIHTFAECPYEEQREFWAAIARQQSLKSQSFRVAQTGLLLGKNRYDRVWVSGPVSAKLLIKHEITEDELARVLQFVNQATGPKDGVFRADVQVERRGYRVLLAAEEGSDRVRLITMFRL